MPIMLDRALTYPPAHTSFADRTILHWAVGHGELHLVRKLLQREKVDRMLSLPDLYGATPLHTATLLGSRYMVALLLGKGANINTAMDGEVGDGWTPLHCAAFCGYAQIAWVLLGAGADTEAKTHVGGDTPLFLASLRDDEEMRRLLIRHGADTLARRKDDSGIEEFVFTCNHKQLLKILPTSVFERLWAIEKLCRCNSCMRTYNRQRSYKRRPRYPRGSTRWDQGDYVTH